MSETLHRDSLSGRSVDDASVLAAWERARELEDREVFDVNGELLGKVTRCFEEDGALARCDVTLTQNARGVLGARQRVAGVPVTWIARVDDAGIHLDHAGEELVRPEDPRPLGADEDRRGSHHLPRKER